MKTRSDSAAEVPPTPNPSLSQNVPSDSKYTKVKCTQSIILLPMSCWDVFVRVLFSGVDVFSSSFHHCASAFCDFIYNLCILVLCCASF